MSEGKNVVLCKECGHPEYWGEMRWLSGRCMCRDCYRKQYEDETGKAYQGQVNADDGLNCRTEPVSGKVVKTYPDGTVLVITKEDGNWGCTGEGWVCLDYITKIASAKDPAAKEENIMTGKEFKKMYDELNPTYNTIDEVPSYWRADIKELVDKGIIAGTGGGKLGLTHSDCKVIVLAKRIKEKL